MHKSVTEHTVMYKGNKVRSTMSNLNCTQTVDPCDSSLMNQGLRKHMKIKSRIGMSDNKKILRM